MKRRTFLGTAGTTLLLSISGCSSATEDTKTPENQHTPTVTSGNTPAETSGDTPRDEEEPIEAGTPMIQVHGKVTDDHPDDVTPISSSDERIADVALFSDLLDEVDEAAQQQTEEELIGDLFAVWADRDTEKGTEAETAMKNIPLMEQRLELSGSESTEEGVYVTHDGHILFMSFRVFHGDS